MDIKLIIFDFDGTIIDTKKTIVVAKQETLRQMGLPVANEQDCVDTIGLSAKKGFQKLCPELSEDMIDLCMKKYSEIFDETKKTVPPVLFPNTIKTLNVLREKGFVCTIATSRGRKSLEDLLNEMNIADYFSYILTAEDTTKLKPDPEPVLKTLKDLSFNVENTLVVGDMPFDILMGRDAGTYTCGVTYGVSDRDSLIEAGVDWVTNDIRGLLKILRINP